MVVRQYPDTLTLFIKPESTQDENGDWQSGGSPAQKQYDCRYEANTKNRVIIGEDGSKTDFSGTVYLQTSDIIPSGVAYSLTRHNGTVITGQVKGVDPGQMNVKIWV